MKAVFVVQHVRVGQGGEEDIKFVGVYRSLEAARAAIARLKEKPGFREAPRVIDPLRDDDEAGFYIDEYELDKDHWSEGFGTG
jgi:hypothetical protein